MGVKQIWHSPSPAQWSSSATSLRFAEVLGSGSAALFEMLRVNISRVTSKATDVVWPVREFT